MTIMSFKPPVGFLPVAKESDLGHISSLVYIIFGHFDAKNEGTTLPGSRVSRQSQRVRGGYNFFSSSYKQKQKTFKFRYSELLKRNFGCFSQKIANFQVNHVYDVITIWCPILFILASMVYESRGDPYASIDTKPKFIGVRLRKSREGLNTPLRRVTKI